MNRLQYEQSPYLISHANDPVDWYPWGEEAFAQARQEQKPLLIAIGTLPKGGKAGGTVARLTRRYYIPVQVDAREHPDVAAYYMGAARQLLGGYSGGVQVLADSAGRPFFAAREGSEVELAGLLSAAALHWNSDPQAYSGTARLLDSCVRKVSEKNLGSSRKKEAMDAHFRALERHYDSQFGGFGTGAKALLPQELLFLLHYAKRTCNPIPRDMAVFTLEQMAVSGVRDHIGGGFFHGTADRQWREPVAEKRLLDQAWMLECYLTAYTATGSDLFARAARETADFVLRELRHGAGGFYTAQWSEDGFYTFTAGEVQGVLGDNDSAVFCRQYDMGTRARVPNLLCGDTPREDTVLLYDLRKKLYRYRLERSLPLRDEMVLVGQNGVMIGALCRAGRILGVQRYLTAAVTADHFLRQRLVGLTDLRRYWCHGAGVGEGALEDYAGYAMGQLELYRSGCGGEHLRIAAKLMARADALFSDPEQGGYYLTRGNRQLPCRPKQLWDESVPSAWSVAVWVTAGLAEEIRHPGLRRRAAELAEQVDEGCGYALTACPGA